MYQTDIKYIIIHVILGALSYYYPMILPIFSMYQLIQLVLNKRVFMFEFKIKDGNSLQHTSNKMIQFFLGYSIVYIGHLIIYLNKYIQ